MKSLALLFMLTGLSLLCWRCSTNLAGGGSSEAEGFTLAGSIVDSVLRPISGARVALFAVRPLVQADSPAAAIDSTRSGADGRFLFKRVPRGLYAVLATANEATLAGLRSGIELARNDTLDAVALARAANVSGRLPVSFPYSRAQRVVLAGTPYRSSVTAEGGFLLAGIVPGTYALDVVLQSNFTFADPAVIGAVDTVALAPGQSLVLDSLRAPGLGGTNPFLVDGFSDCDLLNSMDGVWWSTNDRGLGGNSKVDSFAAVDPGDGSGGAPRVSPSRSAIRPPFRSWGSVPTCSPTRIRSPVSSIWRTRAGYLSARRAWARVWRYSCNPTCPEWFRARGTK